MNKELEMVKNLAQEGKIQEALTELQYICLIDSKNEEVRYIFGNTYNTKEMIQEIQKIDEEFDYIFNVDLTELGIETILEAQYTLDGEVIVKEATKESILDTIEEIERVLKIA